MPTVVTGASGHLGATLVRQLLARGDAVKAVDLEPGLGLDGLDVQVHRGDIRDAAFLGTVVEPGDVVFHLASIISTSGDKGGLVTSVNVDGAATVARVCRERGAARLVHTSSIHAYDIDTHGAPVTETTPLAIGRSRSAYNVSKAKGQLAVLDEVSRGLDAVVVNPCGVIGPYDYKASRMGKFFRAIAKGNSGPVGPGGFNWVDVRDVVDGMLAAAERGRAGEAYILAGHYNTNLALGRIAADIVGKPIPDRVIPMWFLSLLHAAGPVLSVLGRRPPVTSEALDALKANPEMSHAKATAALGYQPRPVADTIRGIYDWLTAEDILAKESAARKAARAAKAA
ncbi:MAG: NAD-dependent epimerase/dehydratase family protein [Alphaproteobacteria bacterium]|nr:NAD-dependent epimerase/dehydratase family protein [Alphaproteobacteria bacterium]